MAQSCSGTPPRYPETRSVPCIMEKQPVRTNSLRCATLLLGLATLLGLGHMSVGQDKKEKDKQPPALKPTHADVKYGPHERNVFDLYLPESDKPTPLVLFIHGGGFRAGDKRGLNAAEGKAYLDAGFAVAAINYRFTDT